MLTWQSHACCRWTRATWRPQLTTSGGQALPEAIVEDALGRGQGAGEHVRLRCALMRLSLPVELLAAQLLQLPLHEAASDA